ncbi:MAG: hypothetical protein KAS66_09420 [Candidatus Omnitrophica bacterium]|nr:hypothetical protein [Candidatus Omnitrophota bacterium]
MDKLLQGVLFVSAVSGLIYKNHAAAGDISCVIVEGKRFYHMEATKLTNAMHSDGEDCAVLEKSSIPGDEETFNNGVGW